LVSILIFEIIPCTSVDFLVRPQNAKSLLERKKAAFLTNN